MTPKLSSPEVDDYLALTKVFAKKRWLSGRGQRVVSLYKKYRGHYRNPSRALNPHALSKVVPPKDFKAAYDAAGDKPAIKFIAEVRAGAKLGGSCVYCGCNGAGTVDHFLPIEYFPHLSIFSLNLVRSCPTCQGRKGTYFNPFRKPSILHPYLERLPQIPLFEVRIEPDYRTPKFSVSISKRISTRHQSKLKFHMDRFKIEDQFKAAMCSGWTDQVLDQIKSLPRANRDDVAAVKKWLEQLHKTHTNITHSFNAWPVLLYRSILRNPDLIEYLSTLPGTR